jgi:hypothetical protein
MCVLYILYTRYTTIFALIFNEVGAFFIGAPEHMTATRIVRIHPVSSTGGYEHFSVNTSKVLRVFDSNAAGDLLPVPFDVTADVYLPNRCVAIRPKNAPAGQLWAEIVDTTIRAASGLGDLAGLSVAASGIRAGVVGDGIRYAGANEADTRYR